MILICQIDDLLVDYHLLTTAKFQITDLQKASCFSFVTSKGHCKLWYPRENSNLKSSDFVFECFINRAINRDHFGHFGLIQVNRHTLIHARKTSRRQGLIPCKWLALWILLIISTVNPSWFNRCLTALVSHRNCRQRRGTAYAHPD